MRGIANLPSATWRLNALASLHWRCWHDEWVVFDAGSGQTHLMDALTAATLMLIEASPVDLNGLASRLSEELLLPGNQELQNALGVVLERLASAGLIETAAT